MATHEITDEREVEDVLYLIDEYFKCGCSECCVNGRPLVAEIRRLLGFPA